MSDVKGLRGYELREIGNVVDKVTEAESDEGVKISLLVGVTSDGNPFEVRAVGNSHQAFGPDGASVVGRGR